MGQRIAEIVLLCAVILLVAVEVADRMIKQNEMTIKWQIDKAPENMPIVCQFENRDKPGTYYYAEVIHVGGQWILHVPDGEPTISISQTPPRRWSLVP